MARNSLTPNVPVEVVYDEDYKRETGYTTLVTVLASLPLKKPKDNSFVRKNGNYVLKLIADPDVGLPYGVIPRLLLAFIVTEAVKNKSRFRITPESTETERLKARTISLGRNLAEFLRVLDIPRTGGRIKALREQMKRLFSTAIRCTRFSKDVESGLNVYPVEKYDLWWGKTILAEQDSLWESTVILSNTFYDEVSKSSVVFYIDMLKILRKSALAIDIYLWATYKYSYTKEATVIMWEQLQEQFGADYANDDQGKRDFKKNFKKELKKVQAVFPEASKIQILKDGKGIRFFPGDPHVPKTKSLE